MSTLTLFFTSFLVSLAAVGGTRRVALRYQIGALPSARKIHREFKPLLGGLGIFAGLLIGVWVATLLEILPENIWWEERYFWGGLLVILLTGFVDDIRGVNAWQKFAGQAFSAGLAVFGGCLIQAFYAPGGAVLELGGAGFVFSMLWIMFIMNAVNLLDGLDGLSAGISLITATGFLILAILTGNAFLIVLTIALIGGLLGFLSFNYHPASIFMGDVGSLMLGYLLACFSIEALKVANTHQVYFLASLVLLGMPVTDTLISFFRRMGRGDHPFKADREHIHHRLLKLGLSHLDSVWLMYYFTFFYVALGVLMVLYREFGGILLFAGAFGFSIFWAWRLGYLETRRSITFGVQEQETLAAVRPPIHVDRIWHQIAILLGDIFSVNLAMYLTFWFKFQSGMLNPLTIKSLQDYFEVPVWLALTGVWVVLFWLNGLYQMSWDVTRFNQVLRVTKVLTFGILCLMILLNLDIWMTANPKGPFNPNQISTLGFYWLCMVVAVNGFRLLIIRLEKSLHIFQYTFKNTLLIGTTRKARNVIRDIENNVHLLNQIVGVVDRKVKAPQFAGYPVLGAYADLPELIQQYKIEEIIVAISETAKEDLLNIIGVCDRMQVVVKTLPALQAIVSGRHPDLAGSMLMRAFPDNMVLWQWMTKRSVDILLSSILLLLTAPLWTGLFVLVSSRFGKGALVKIPILGRNGQVFNMFLLRVAGKDEQVQRLYGGSTPQPPLSALGRYLYRRHLYKFPQLFNVLKGDMSFVGPRPEPPEWYRRHQHRLRFLHRRLTVRPGITGIAQVKYRFDSSQKVLKERLKYDVFYSENIALNLDLRIVVRSLLLLFQKPPVKRR